MQNYLISDYYTNAFWDNWMIEQEVMLHHLINVIKNAKKTKTKI